VSTSGVPDGAPDAIPDACSDDFIATDGDLASS